MLRFGNGLINDNLSIGGGIIELISLKYNQGKIECDGTYNGFGGTIKIKCKSFINKGIISAKNNGKIIIILQEFNDDDQKSLITPQPNIIYIEHGANNKHHCYNNDNKNSKTLFDKIWKKQ